MGDSLAFLPALLCRLMLGFMGVTAFLSMWISNTATTAMMVPIVEAMLQQMEATSAATEASLGALELADKGKAGELPGEPLARAPRGPTTAAFPLVAKSYGHLPASWNPLSNRRTEKYLENAVYISFRNVILALDPLVELIASSHPWFLPIMAISMCSLYSFGRLLSITGTPHFMLLRAILRKAFSEEVTSLHPLLPQALGLVSPQVPPL